MFVLFVAIVLIDLFVLFVLFVSGEYMESELALPPGIEQLAKTVELAPVDVFNVMESQIFADKALRHKDGKVRKVLFDLFVSVCNRYKLNPFVKEIHATVMGGKLVPIVGVDGFVTLARRTDPDARFEYVWHEDEAGTLRSVECYVKRFLHGEWVTVGQSREFMEECRGNSNIWNKWPKRMLKHKALIQALREAFGFSGIYDPDEADRIRSGGSEAVEVRENQIDWKKENEAPVGESGVNDE